jgi:hypothetical protein
METISKFSRHGHEIAVYDLPQDTLLKLANYGFNVKLDRASAGKGANDSPEAIEARKAVFAAIISGAWEVAASSGPRLKGLDAVCREVAIERLKAAFAARGHKWPAGKGSAETITGLCTKYLAKYGADVRAEAERRMASTTPADDIFNDLDL